MSVDDSRFVPSISEEACLMVNHDFCPVEGHPDDDECTHRSDGTDATYCGLTRNEHGVP